MLCRKVRFPKRGGARFAAPPWSSADPCWQEIDDRLPPEHVARKVVAAMGGLDWSALYACYSRGGSAAVDPLLLLRIVLIELHLGRVHPQQWWRDARENDALKWAGFGICPARSTWYAFEDRVGPMLTACHRQLLKLALRDGVTTGAQASLDGTSMESSASRHRLLNQDRLEQRQSQLEQACAADCAEQRVR